jgi:yeast amino acid transporter
LVCPPFLTRSNLRGTICFCHIRFRRAWIAQGHTLDELPFRAAAGVYGSYFGVFFNCLILVAQFYVAVWPIGGEPNAQSFFEAYLAVPIILGFYIFWKVFKRTRWVKTMEIDLVSGRRELNLVELKAQEREEQATWGPMKRYNLTKSDSNQLGYTFGFAKSDGTLNSSFVSLLKSNLYM